VKRCDSTAAASLTTSNGCCQQRAQKGNKDNHICLHFWSVHQCISGGGDASLCISGQCISASVAVVMHARRFIIMKDNCGRAAEVEFDHCNLTHFLAQLIRAAPAKNIITCVTMKLPLFILSNLQAD